MADSMKMNRQHEENIARLASLETDVRNLSQDVRLLATSLQTVTDRMAARDRPNWQMLGVAVVIIGAIGTAVITPLTRDVAANERLADMRLREIETQFRWMSDVTNMREREADRRIALLWQKVYQETLPPASLEAAARASRRGIWRSVFIVPWEWRGPPGGGGAGAPAPRRGRPPRVATDLQAR